MNHERGGLYLANTRDLVVPTGINFFCLRTSFACTAEAQVCLSQKVSGFGFGPNKPRAMTTDKPAFKAMQMDYA